MPAPAMTIPESAVPILDIGPDRNAVWWLEGSGTPDDLETFDARTQLGRICGHFNLTRPRWLDSCAIFNIIDDAGVTNLTENEFRIFADTDLAFFGISKADNSRQFVLIGCYDASTGDDIRRSRRNADHFAGITGWITHPVIIGKPPPPDVLETARGHRVLCIPPKQRSHQLYYPEPY